MHFYAFDVILFYSISFSIQFVINLLVLQSLDFYVLNLAINWYREKLLFFFWATPT